jgi:hypothetical protein
MNTGSPDLVVGYEAGVTHCLEVLEDMRSAANDRQEYLPDVGKGIDALQPLRHGVTARCSFCGRRRTNA